jgi:DNA polymerase
LKEEVARCTRCILHRYRNNVVFGDGNPAARIILVGEGPGYDEDQQGIAFVGRAGQLLDKILYACNFTRQEHVYIGNIVKCRPPQNRVPSTEEMIACLPYLEEQIMLIDPVIIVAMGATALKGLIGKNVSITESRGKWMIWNNRMLMPTYHPAALLRNPGLKKDAWNDFKNIVLKYRELVNAGHTCDYI